MKQILQALWARIKGWYNWPTDPNTSWYYKGSLTTRWFGNLAFHTFAGLFFATVAVFIPLGVLWGEGGAKEFLDLLAKHPVVSIFWFAMVTIALPLFIWHEQLAFDNWIGAIRLRPKAKEAAIARFKLNVTHMEACWKTVAGLYVATGLFTFASKNEPPASPPTKADVEALTKAINDLTPVAKAPKSSTAEDIAGLTKAVNELTAVAKAPKIPTTGDIAGLTKAINELATAAKAMQPPPK